MEALIANFILSYEFYNLSPVITVILKHDYVIKSLSYCILWSALALANAPGATAKAVALHKKLNLL